MDPTHLAAATAGPAPAELIVRNGRLKGSARPLTQPLTLIGRAVGCDVRLNVEGIGPLHCALVQGPDGLSLRDLHGGGKTLINGEPARNGRLEDGDLLAIGPFQFQVRVSTTPAAVLAEASAKLANEKDALRIQAAAVAAQQAELTEEEAKLQQRRQALEQQEEQLATHLEEKRKKLIDLREQARTAYNQLREERATQEAVLGERQREMAVLRHEVEEGRAKVGTDRERLRSLFKRMRQRWHRHWSAERSAIQQREAQVAQVQRGCERADEKLRQEKAALVQARLAFNGDVEIGRRELQAARDQLRKEQRAAEDFQAQALADLADHQADLDDRDAALADAERDLADEQQRWQDVRLELEREVEGLENRVRNHRRKILDHEENIQQLEAKAVELRAKTESPDAALPAEEPQPAPAVAVALTPPVAIPVAENESAPAALRLAVLEKLAGELADQRLHLVEQCERLVRAQQRWQHNRDAAAAELEVVGRRLHEREQATHTREQAVEAIEVRLRQQQREAAHLQRFLEGWQTRMTARESTWEAERDRLLAELQGREKLAGQRLQAIDQLHQRWAKRRRREIEFLRGERAALDKLRREWIQLRDDWLRRGAALEAEQRSLAERSLAMEQYQQEALGQAENASAAQRRLEKLRRRWAALSAAAEKSIKDEREALDVEAARLEELHTRLSKQTQKLAVRESELSGRLSDWERDRLRVADEIHHLRQELTSTTAQRERSEKQVADLRDEVERLARLLLDDVEPVRLPTAQAA